VNTVEHLLVCLMEECAEVQQAASKCLRFGLDDKYPERNSTNREDLLNELVDLDAIAEMLQAAKVVGSYTNLDYAMRVRRKKQKVAHWMAYACQQGVLVPTATSWDQCQQCRAVIEPGETVVVTGTGNLCQTCAGQRRAK
jgi:hypothetical protein